MRKIIEVITAVNYGNFCIVEVRLDNQETAEVYVGGSVEVFFHKDKLKAFVKKKP